jgi:hypothetical protein
MTSTKPSVTKRVKNLQWLHVNHAVKFVLSVMTVTVGIVLRKVMKMSDSKKDDTTERLTHRRDRLTARLERISEDITDLERDIKSAKPTVTMMPGIPT